LFHGLATSILKTFVKIRDKDFARSFSKELPLVDFKLEDFQTEEGKIINSELH